MNKTSLSFSLRIGIVRMRQWSHYFWPIFINLRQFKRHSTLEIYALITSSALFPSDNDKLKDLWDITCPFWVWMGICEKFPPNSIAVARALASMLVFSILTITMYIFSVGAQNNWILCVRRLSWWCLAPLWWKRVSTNALSHHNIDVASVALQQLNKYVREGWIRMFKRKWSINL